MDVHFQQMRTKDTFILHFNEDSTVKDAKEELNRTQNVLLDNILLIFKNKTLLDTVRLSEIQTSEAEPIFFFGKPKDAIQSNITNTPEDFQEILINKIEYKINKTKKTATIINFIPNNQDAYIPRSIQHESQEFIVTSIDQNISTYIKSVKFAPDCEITSLENVFSGSLIKTVSIHPSLTKISQYSFSGCNLLTKINFQPKSQLQIIEQNAFYKSAIKSISIPSSTIQIDGSAFELCSGLQKVQIPANSKLKKIEANAFKKSGIVSLSLPSSVSELDYSWCCGIEKLNDIKIFQCEQQNISYFDEKLILKKSDPKSDVFDILIFARRDIKTVVIPPFIKKIADYAFENCTSIESIEISENSKLQEIGRYAFHFSSIESISFPPHLMAIGKGCFESCIHLKTIEIPKNSELFIIGQQAFDSTIIESISIPIHLTKIDEKVFNYCKELKRVDIPENCELQTIGKSAFFFTSIEEITFSSHLKLLQECSFHICRNLKKLVFTPSSTLLTIEKDIFGSSSPLKSISFPSSNIDFNDGWCNGLNYLSNIEIIPNGRQDIIYYDDKYILRKSNNESDVYDVLEFARRDIKIALIPSFIKIIRPFAFNCCKKLQKIEFQENSELVLIDNHAFASSSIEKVIIPPTVKTIGEGAFSYCSTLTQVESSIDSQLTEIENKAFEATSINEILIPASVLSIENSVFNNCYKLKKVEFTEDSNLTKIGKYCFNNTNIEQFTVPKNVLIIERGTFHIFIKLKNIDFQKDSKLQKICESAFKDCLFEKISIPASVICIEQYPFSKKVKKIDIPTDSKIQTFQSLAFKGTSIKSLLIPPLVKILDANIFFECHNLQIIEIAENSQLEQFSLSDLKNVIIMTPSFLLNSVKVNKF